MIKVTDDSKWTAPPPKRRWFAGLRGFITTTLLLAALLYGGVYALGLMDGFRALLEDHLKARLDLKLKIGKAWLTPAFNLKFENITTEHYGRKSYPGVQIQKGYVEWSLHDARGWHGPRVQRVIVSGVGVAFAPNDAGRWEPTPLAGIGQQVADWCGFKVDAPKPERTPAPRLDQKPADTAKPTDNLLGYVQHALVEVDNARLTWWDADEHELASADRLRLVLTPLRLPSREIKHCWLRIAEVRLADGRRANDIRCEFFDLDTQKMMLEFRADWLPGNGGAASNATPAKSSAAGSVR
jgi:hypothetical protein